ncbi:zinc-binding dehydrogenase [Saccharothrix variisporea]|uniref:NADPH2:quinone reductase n=1 Tax=Saccharothrix variisporea TaxID=543527 RepID=A0A495XHT7_9PSEU|nr:zinc-binding dehydrogenase [Saccharothrix variisporea]RKT73617.1 NADPH2:quinone reductase [Saccharothrix variisporea]
MRAIRQYEFGSPETLKYEEVADPVPGEGQVLVSVAAAGVHLLDTSIRSGESGGPWPLPELPMTPGREVAGTVVGGDPAWRGKRVVAHLGQAGGGYAELAAVNVASLHELPEHVSFEEAVAMIGTGRTAVGVLRIAQLEKDDVVLVTAAAGGLGALFVQEAKAVGATVVGLASTAKLGLVRELGADHAVDYTQPDWPDAVRAEVGEASVVLDGVGGAAGRQALELLGIGGRTILFGWSAGEPTRIETLDLYQRGLTAAVAVGPRIMKGTNLRELETLSLQALADGRLKPLTTVFRLEDAPQAHAALEGRRTTGKVVLKA